MVNKLQSNTFQRNEGLFNEDSYFKVAFKVAKTVLKVITVVPLVFELVKHIYNSMKAKKEAKNPAHSILPKIISPLAGKPAVKSQTEQTQNRIVKLFKENRKSILVASTLCIAALSLKYFHPNISFPSFEFESQISKNPITEFILDRLPSKESIYYLAFGGLALGSVYTSLSPKRYVGRLDPNSSNEDDIFENIDSVAPVPVAHLKEPESQNPVAAGDLSNLGVKPDPTQAFSNSSLFKVYLSEYNQTSENIAGAYKNIQSCASNALAFLNLAFNNREKLNSLDQIGFGGLIERSLRDGYSEDSNLRRKYPARYPEKNCGAFIEDLAELHRERTSLSELDFNSSFFNQEIGSDQTPSLVLEVSSKENMDYSPLLSIKPRPDYNGDIGFIIFKGGKSFALYKHGDDFYFYDSHGTIEATDNTGAYIVKSKDINSLLRSFDYFSDPKDGEAKHAIMQFYTVLPKNA